MPDLIKLLPDSVANQIAAGEVIQRPASIVKELAENAIDAGATKIAVIVKDAGKTLVQIIDNGMGMSETDARLSFERHATSKIKKANDLFAIQTMGFRGEALASIAAIAHVDLKTKKTGSELGTFIQIAGSKVNRQEPVSCPSGCNFLVKNLFFNVPARRKFLKSDSTEWRHILEEFYRIVLANPDIEFSLKHNDEEIFHLLPGNYKQRIVAVFGKNINQNLVRVKSETSIITINGYIGKPEYARKKSGQQFFFVNKRYMRHPYFYKAVNSAYENLITNDVYPSFFLYFSVDPKNIDINIHPTKTEIKFEDEMSIWQILQATVKEALGKYNIVPSLDFNMEQSFNIPASRKNETIKPPEIKVNHSYNPFDNKENSNFENRKDDQIKYWEKLFSENQNGNDQIEMNHNSDGSSGSATNRIFQYKNKYIVTPVKSGLMLIHQKRAHQRILFEKFMSGINTGNSHSQRLLYPVSVELNPSDFECIMDIKDVIAKIGFDLDVFGKNTIVVNAVPEELDNTNTESYLDGIIEQYKTSGKSFEEECSEQVAISLAKAASANHNKVLSEEEMKILIDTLFGCENPHYSPEGKNVIVIISFEEIERKFK